LRWDETMGLLFVELLVDEMSLLVFVEADETDVVDMERFMVVSQLVTPANTGCFNFFEF